MKIKRIVGAALAAIMALSLTVPVMAEGRDESIPGEGKVGLFQTQSLAPTIAPIEEDDQLVGGTNDDKYPGQEALQHNVEGAIVTVTWPRGQGQTQTVVDASGAWSIDTSTISLKKDDVVRAVQQESGKSVSLETVAIVGSGEPGKVEERSIAPTISVTDVGATGVRGSNDPADFDPSGRYPQQNVPGARIDITWPDGTTGTATVNIGGVWTADFTRPLVLDEKVTAVQTEPGKLPSYPVVVTVGSGDPGIVDPPIVITRPEDYLVLSVPYSFEWFVNQTDPNVVQSGQSEYKVTVHSLDLPSGGSYDARVDVSLKEFKKTNNVDLGSALVLTFTGDFGTVITGDISNGVTNAPVSVGQISTYGDPGDKDTLTFGFGGSYNGTLTNDVKIPTYSMILNFKLNETDAPIG